MNPNRRTVLLAGVAALVGATTGGVALALRGTVQRTPPSELLALDSTEYSVLCAIADTLLPGGSDLPTGTNAGVPSLVDRTLTTMHPADRSEFKQALMLIENALVSTLLDGRTTTFTGSSPEVRTEALKAWQSSTIGVRQQAFKALHGLCSGAYWSQPQCYRITGYTGPQNFGQASATKPTTFDEVPS